MRNNRYPLFRASSKDQQCDNGFHIRYNDESSDATGTDHLPVTMDIATRIWFLNGRELGALELKEILMSRNYGDNGPKLWYEWS